LVTPLPSAAYCDNISWYLGGMVGALEALADLKGVKLDADMPAAVARPSRWSPVFDVLATRFLGTETSGAYELKQYEGLVTLARRLEAQKDVESEYIEEAGKLLGHAVLDWKQADRELEEFVLSAGPEHDEALIQMFYRWCRRQASLLEGLVYMPNLTTRLQPFSEIIF